MTCMLLGTHEGSCAIPGMLASRGLPLGTACHLVLGRYPHLMLGARGGAGTRALLSHVCACTCALIVLWSAVMGGGQLAGEGATRGWGGGGGGGSVEAREQIWA